MLYKKYSCDKKHISTLLLILGWLLTGLFIFIFGIINTHADSLEHIGYLTDNSDVSVEVTYVNSPLTLNKQNSYQLESVKAINIYISNYTFNAGITYDIEFSLPQLTLKNIDKLDVFGGSDNTCVSSGIDNSVLNYPHFRFNCSKTTQYINLRISNSNNQYITDTGLFRWNYVYLSKLSSSTDNSILESQNSHIIDQNNQIINGQEELKNSINNVGESIQQGIKDGFENCRESKNLISSIHKKGDILFLNDTISYTDYVFPAGTYTFSYKSSTTIVSYIKTASSSSTSLGTSKTITFTSNEPFNLWLYRSGIANTEISEVQLEKGTSASLFEPYGEKVCSNRIDETNNQLGNLNNALTDSSPVSLDSLSDTMGWLPPGPIDSILTLPLAMLNNLTNALNRTCSPLLIDIPYIHSKLPIPCLSTIFAQITGLDSFWHWVGVIASTIITYQYLLSLYAWVDKVLTLRAEFDEAMGVDMANWGRI